MEPTTTACGTWSGGHFMHIGETLSEERFIGCIETAYEADIRTFVTSDGYGNGKADELLGKALKGIDRSTYSPAGSGRISNHRRCILLFRLLPFLMLGLFTTALHALQFEDFTYSSYADRVIITGYTGLGGAVTIPETIGGLPVLSFTSAFSGNATIISVTIPETVTGIDNDAFLNCTGLTSITIPSSIRNIGSFAFFNCTGLMSVSISSGVMEISDSAFRACTRLTNVSIPSSVTFIGTQAFDSCSNLEVISVDASSTTYSASEVAACSNTQLPISPFGFTPEPLASPRRRGTTILRWPCLRIW